jgi:hypothetical protein
MNDKIKAYGLDPNSILLSSPYVKDGLANRDPKTRGNSSSPTSAAADRRAKAALNTMGIGPFCEQRVISFALYVGAVDTLTLESFVPNWLSSKVFPHTQIPGF